MSSVPLPNNSEKSRTAALPSIGKPGSDIEGTVDSSLNEAPQLIQRLIAAARPFLDPDIVDETTGTIGLMDELEAAISAAESLLRDGQPR